MPLLQFDAYCSFHAMKNLFPFFQLFHKNKNESIQIRVNITSMFLTVRAVIYVNAGFVSGTNHYWASSPSIYFHHALNICTYYCFWKIDPLLSDHKC